MAEKEKRTFEAETLGLSPLKMVLVETASKRDRKNPNRSDDHRLEPLSKKDVVIRLIDYFSKKA
jgi:hypothetical protein